MDIHETKLVKEAVARTLSELDQRVPPGPQDSWRGKRNGGVSLDESREIREIVRNFSAIQKFKDR
jgi:hypothetical protein